MPVEFFDLKFEINFRRQNYKPIIALVDCKNDFLFFSNISTNGFGFFLTFQNHCTFRVLKMCTDLVSVYTIDACNGFKTSEHTEIVNLLKKNKKNYNHITKLKQ